MANRLIKSVLWFCGLSGIGVALLAATTPSQDQLDNFSKDYPGLEKDHSIREKRYQQFTSTLQTAAKSEKPLYLMTKKELDELIKK